MWFPDEHSQVHILPCQQHFYLSWSSDMQYSDHSPRTVAGGWACQEVLQQNNNKIWSYIHTMTRSFYVTQVKVKVKVTLVQALRLCTGRMAHRGSRGIALPFHDHDIRRGWGVSVTPWPFFTPGKTWYPLYRRLGGPQGLSGQVRKISPPPGFDPQTVQPVASRYTDYATWPTYASHLAAFCGFVCVRARGRARTHILKC